MHEADPRMTEPIPRATGGMTRLAFARAKDAGVEPEPMLKKAGLGRSLIEDADARLGVRSQITFLNLVAEALPDEFLGFHLALATDLRAMGMLYYVAASSDSLGDALRRAARYGKVVNEGVTMGYTEGDDVAIRFDYVGVPRHLDRHQIEALVTLLVRLCRHLVGQRVRPVRVAFTHRRSGDTTEFDAFLGCDAEFGADVDELVFAAATKSMPVSGADPYLNKLLVAQFDEALLHRQPVRGAFRASVENAIAPLLPHGQARAGEVSRRLGISQRTFERRLAAEGMTFSGVVQNLRSTLAQRHLNDPGLSISQIAWLLGYQEVSAFTHAFKRWTGTTPRAVRARQKHAA